MAKPRQTQSALAERMNLGQVLVDLCLVSPDDVRFAASRQRENGKRIGETLVEAGAITEDQLSGALDLQQRLRSPAIETNVEAVTELLERAREQVLGLMRLTASR